MLAVCADVAADGTTAAVTVHSASLSLELIDASGTLTRLNQPLDSLAPSLPIAERCDAHFDEGGELIAVGVKNDKLGADLQIVVADVKRLDWIGRWRVDRSAGFHSPTFAGFFDRRPVLAVVGALAAANGQSHGSMAILLFDSRGQQLAATPAVRAYAEGTDAFPNFVDARHNRLWVCRCSILNVPMSQQPLFPIESLALTGSEDRSPEFPTSSSGVNRSDLWFLPEVFAAPDRNTVILAEGARLWRVDVQAQAIDSVTLPVRSHFPSLVPQAEAAAISPDGQIAAVAMTESALAFPYLVDNHNYNGREVAVVQLRPLKTLGVVRNDGPREPSGLAVDHRKGKVALLMYGKDGWQRRDLPEASRPQGRASR